MYTNLSVFMQEMNAYLRLHYSLIHTYKLVFTKLLWSRILRHVTELEGNQKGTSRKRSTEGSGGHKESMLLSSRQPETPPTFR